MKSASRRWIGVREDIAAGSSPVGGTPRLLYKSGGYQVGRGVKKLGGGEACIC